MAEKTIAYVTPLYFDERSYLGGGERYPLNVARGVVIASNEQFRVELLSFGDRAHRATLAPGVSLRVLKAHHRPTNMLDVMSWELPEAIADVDLVHIHQGFTRCSEVGLLSSRLMGKPVCVTDHGGATSTLGAEVGHLHLADRLIAYSDFGASLLPKTTRAVEVVKGGVDCQIFTPPTAPVKRDRALYVGRLLPHKGIDTLLRAIPPDLPLTICGRAYHKDYYALLCQLARGKRVDFVTDASDNDLRELYQRAWVNVLPSVYRDYKGQVYRAPELMGLTLLEAMACGTPAIASRVGAMPEFIEHGETGFVFDTPEELRAQITRLASDQALVERLGRAARAAVETKWDIRTVGARMVDIYSRVIGDARAWEEAA